MADDLIVNDILSEIPLSDSDLPLEKDYDESTSGTTTETFEPIKGDAVVGYDPSKDQRRRQGSH